MGYSLHYLMFWHRPSLPVDFYFPTLRSTEFPEKGVSAKHVDEYVATVWDCLKAALQVYGRSSKTEWYYNQKIGAIGLKAGNLILVKADAFQGKRKMMDRWEDKPHEVVPQIVRESHCTKWKTSREIHMSYITTSSSSLHQNLAFPCMWVSNKYGKDVPAPPQSSLLPGGVTERLHHKKIMVWWSSSIMLGRLLWGG